MAHEDSTFAPCDRYYKIVGSSENYSAILSKLREEGLNFELDNGSELLPITTIEVCFKMNAVSFLGVSFSFCPCSFDQFHIVK